MKAILKDDCEFEKTSQLLENNYPELYNAIQNDDYTIQYEEFDAFCEITDENEVVGFYTFQQIDKYTTSINEIYILKDYRGKNRCSEILLDMFLIPNSEFYIRNPNQNIIKVLLKNGFAMRIDDNLVYSFFEFLASSNDLYRNPNIKRLYRKPEEESFFSANFYDDNLKCVVTASEENNVTKQESTMMIIEARKNDLKKYKLRKKLKKVTTATLDSLMEKIYYSLEESEEFRLKTFRRIIDLNSIENLIEKVNTDNKEEIIENVENSIENDELLPRYTKVRLAYLLENPDRINRKADMSLLPDNCPLCETELHSIHEICPTCGFSIYNVEDEMMLIDGDDKLYREVMDKIRKNGWDADEILNLQCLGGICEFIKMSERTLYLPINNLDESNKLKKGTIAEYGVKHGYLDEITYEEYIDMIENEYTKDDLETEAQHYRLEPKTSKRALIKQIKEFSNPENQAVKYNITEKGRKLCENCEILDFYSKYLNTFLFCEFKKFVDEHDYPLEKSCEEFIKEEYEKGIENRNWRVYKQMLKYKLEITEDAEEYLELAIQTLIYDLNCDDLKDKIGLGFEFDSAMYIMQGLSKTNTDLDEAFQKAYDEFELDELKGKKQECHEVFMEICESKTFESLKEFIQRNQ